MIRKIKNLMLALAISFGFLVPVALPGVVSAGAEIREQLCGGVNLGDPSSMGEHRSCAGDEGGTSVNSIVTDVVNFLSWFVGIVSVIMIIVGGFRYITSGGSNDKVTSAKNTIVYAIIGLIIVALAQFIVNFVIDRVTSTGEA